MLNINERDQKILEKVNAKKAAILNELTANGLDILQNTYRDQEIDLGKGIKLSARITLPLTKSANFGVIRTFALYTGDFGYYNHEENQTVAYADGFYRLSTSVVKRYAKQQGISLSHLAGIGFQARFGFIKGECLTFSPRDIQLQIVTAVKKYKAAVEFVEFNDPGYENLLKDIQHSADYTKNKIYIFGTKSLWKVDYFGDSTTCKAIFDFSLSPSLNVMEIPQEFKSGTKTSSQMLAGVMGVPGAKEVFLDIAKRDIDEIWNLESEEEIKSILPIKDIDFADNTVKTIDINYVLRDRKLAASLAKNMLQASIKKICRYNYKIDGLYGKIVPDLGLDFDLQIINWGEIYIAGTSKYVDKHVEVIRYPKTSPSEHFSCVIIGLDTIKERIVNAFKAGKISARDSKFLVDFYKNTKNGNIVVPSGYKAFANLEGGLDYDGDAVCVIFEETLVGLYSKVPMGAIEYGDVPKATETMQFDINAMDYAYFKGVTNANTSVGQAVNFAYSCLAVAQSLEKITDEEYEKFIDEVKKEVEADENFQKNEYGDNNVADKFLETKAFFEYFGEYTRMFASTSTITEKDVDAFLVKAYAAGAGKRSNMINILLDANMAYSSIVGRTIDSTKNGALVHAALIWLNRFFKGGINQDVVMKESGPKEEAIASWLNYSFNHIKTGFQQFVTKSGKVRNFYVSNDVLAQLQNDMLDYMLGKAKEYIDKVEEIAKVNVTSYVPTMNRKHIVDSIAYVAVINNGISFGVPESMNKVKPYFVDMVRSMTTKLDYKTRLELVKEASTIRGEATGFRNNFGVEMVIDALGNKDFNVRELVYSFDKDYEFVEGQPIYLEKGRNKDVYTKEKITGLFFVTIINGKPYVETSVKDYALQHDKSTRKYTLSLTALDENMKFDDFINRLSLIYQRVQDGEYTLEIQENKAGGGFVIAKDKAGKTYGVAKVVTPRISKERNVIEKYVFNHKISLDYIESYQPKKAGKGNEFVAIFGELLD